MKIRNGFVSNSSSSSFCLYGVEVDDLDMQQFVEGVDFDNDEWTYEVDWYEISSQIEKVFGTEFSFEYDGECCEEFYIGRTLESLKDDETGKQFRDSVNSKVKEIFGPDAVCKVHTDIIAS